MMMHKIETNMFTVTCGFFVLMCTKCFSLQIFKDTKVKERRLEVCSYLFLKGRNKRIAREPGANNRNGSPLPPGLPSTPARKGRGIFPVLH